MRFLRFRNCIVFGCLCFALSSEAATWTKLVNTSPASNGVMLQMTDGTILVQNNTNFINWMKLTPDANGSYINGTWTSTAPMTTNRLYFTSNVLPSGKLWVLGGEYTGPNLDANWSPTAEIYDPVANTWTTAAAFPPQAGCPTGRTVRVSGNLTTGSNLISGFITTAQIAVGMSISGTGIPASTVTSVDTLTQIHISNNATATSIGVALAFVGTPPACFGDVPSSLLSGGRILAGNLINKTTSIFDFNTNTWSAGGTKVYDQSDEETWAKLPNGKIITYDLFKSFGTLGAYAELYDPAANIWSSISPSDGSALGTIPQLSSSALGAELGGMLRLQDGRIFVLGATEHTAFYNPTTNTWSAGPDIIGTINGNPAKFGQDDAPATIMPNGHVFFAADAGPALVTTTGNTTVGSNVITNVADTSTLVNGWAAAATGIIPSSTTITSFTATTVTLSKNALSTQAGATLKFGGIFSKPTQLFDLNPNTNTISPVSPAFPGTSLADNPSFVTRTHILPTGQVLFSDSTSSLWVYTPDGPPVASARPVVNNITYNGSGLFTLTGKQINGQSAGSSYGDDVQNDANYPIIRLANSSGQVFYCTTSNWSSVDVAGGNTPQTVNFRLKAGLPAGNYFLFLSGAGIPSFPVAINITATQAAGL